MIFQKRFILWILFIFSFSLSQGQIEICVNPDEPLDLSTIDFPGCSGATTYDISSSNFGLNCEDCGPIIFPDASENILVTANVDGSECGDESVTIIFLDAEIDFDAGVSPDCNAFSFSGSSSATVSSWSWDFNGDGIPDSNNASTTYTFPSNGNQTVNLTVTSPSGDCSYTTSIDLFVSGPWAELSFQGNLDGDDEYTGLFPIAFNGDDCTIPYCVDDIGNEHCIILSDFPHPNGAGNITYSITVDGSSVYSNGSSVPPANITHCYPSNFSGFSTVVYEITDAAGCVFTKEYSIYVAEDISPDTDLINLTPSPDGYCLDETIQIQFTAANTNPEDVTYILAISCPTFSFADLNPVFIDTLYLSPGQTQLVDWEVTNSSCECDFGQFVAISFVTNPCSTTPIFSSSFAIDVPLDTDASFNAPDILCQNTTYNFDWLGAEFLGNGACDADIEWSITEPDGTVINDAGDDEDFSWTFDQIGDYEVCLEIVGDCNSDGSIQCEEICVQPQLTAADLTMTWPDLTLTEVCAGDTYEPEVLVDLPVCDELDYLWSVSPSGGTSITGPTSTNPMITFNQKGNYTVNLTVFSDCGNVTTSSEIILVAEPPIITNVAASLQGCPGEPLCLDEAFCIDNCNSDFINATISIYEGSAADCDPSGLTEVWSAPGNPLINFPAEFDGIDCFNSNGSCFFTWDVPDDFEGSYTAIISLENGCGTALDCIPIEIINVDDPVIDFPLEYCAGEILDPSLTSFSNCTWLDNGSVIWNGFGVITFTEDVTLTISCIDGACPLNFDVDITVNPLPIVDISGTDVICIGGSSELTATPGFSSYQWYSNSCALSSGADLISGEDNNTLTVTTPGTYSVVVQDANGCSSCTEYIVNEDVPPTFFCSAMSICESELDTEIDLSCLVAPIGGWGSTTPLWTLTENGSEISTDIEAPYTVQDLLNDYSASGGDLTANTTFELTYNWTSDLGCDYSDSFEIEIQFEGITIEEVEICTSNTLTLTGDGSFGFWELTDLPASAGADFNGVNFNWTPLEGDEGGPYTVNFISGAGCSSISYLIDVYLSPSVNAEIASGSNLCGGGEIELTSTPGFSTYTWYEGGCADAGGLEILGEESNTLDATDAGIYCVEITDSNGCSAQSSIEIIADPAPQFNCVDLTFCEIELTEEIDLTCLESPTGIWDTDPIWSLEIDGLELNSDIGWSYSVEDVLNDLGSELTENQTFDFIYNWTSASGCDYTDTLLVTIQFEGISNEVIGVCNDTELIILGDGSVGSWDLIDLPASAGADFSGSEFVWTPSGTDFGGPYAIEFISGSGCSSINYEIEVFENPVVSLEFNSGNSESNLCPGLDLAIEATLGFEDYAWYTGGCDLTGDEISGEEDEQLIATTDGTYAVLITDENGCQACDDITVVFDPSPSFLCDDITLCEIDLATEIDLTCLEAPSTGWGVDDPVWNINDSGDLLNNDVNSPYSLEDILDDLGAEMTVTTDFDLSYSWTSPSGCFYTDTLVITVLNEEITFETIEVCSNEEIDLIPDGSLGYWEIINLPLLPDTSSTASNFIWNTGIDDVGNGFQILFFSGLGCSSFDYSFVVHETPEGSITADNNDMCLDDVISLTLDPGIADNETLSYDYDTDLLDLSVIDAEFDPTSLGLSPLDDGTLIYEAWIDYDQLNGEILTCSFIDETDIVIADFPESLFVPDFLCEGQEFSIAPCDDPYIDAFELSLDAFILSDCPLEFPDINGEQDFNLNVIYGGDLLCEADTSGSITIQEQLAVNFSSSFDECAGTADVSIELTGGIIDNIEYNPGGVFTDDVLEQSVDLPIDDIYQDQLYFFDVNISDGGCDALNFEFDGQYIAPLNPFIFIEEGPYCSGDIIEFTVSQVGSAVVDSVLVFPGNDEDDYTWIDDNYAEPLEFQYLSPLDSTTYTLGLQLFNPCHDTLVEISFTVDPPELIASIEPNFQVCPGEEIDFTPIILGSFNGIDLDIEDGLDLDLVEIGNPFVYIVSEDQDAGFYDIDVILTPDCGDPITLTTTVEVFGVPAPEIDALLSCSGQSSSLNIANSSVSETYEWIVDGGDYFGAEIDVIFNAVGIYPVEVIATNQNGCSSTIVVEVEISGIAPIIPMPSVAQCGNLEMTLGTNLEPLQNVTWTITNNITSDSTIFYINNQSFEFINPDLDESITYYIDVMVEDIEGCSSEETSIVSIYPDGDAEILISEGDGWTTGGTNWVVRLDEVCSEKPIYFKDGFGSNTCSWDSPLENCSSGQIGSCPIYTLCLNEDQNGMVILETANSYGCVASDSIYVVPLCGEDVVFFVPNSFTPDNDGLNDVFYVEGKNFDPDQFKMQIYNRWGEVIFETEDHKEVWIGNDERGDHYVVDDVYVYKIFARHKLTKERTEHVGHVSVIR